MLGPLETKIAPSRLPDPSSGPWLVFRHGKHGYKSQTFFSITKREFYVRSIQELRKHQDQFFQVTSYGWFLMADPQSSQCFLWNPVTLVRIELPVSPHSFINFKCILSSPPTDSDCTVMCCNFLKQYVMFCCPGDKVWICHQYSDISVREVLSCKGQFYGVTALRELVIFNFDPEPRLIIMDIARSKPRRNCWHNEALLESCGDIFLVDRFLVDSMKSTGDIEVLVLDLSKQRWDEVDDIGDRVFLVNSFGSSESLSASRLGIKKGCIYFTDCWDKHLYVYDLEEQIISSTLPCPNVKEKFWTPFFLIPSLAL